MITEYHFPTPIYISNINRPYTKQELEFVNQQKKICVTNEGNTTTKNNYTGVDPKHCFFPYP